MGRRPIGKRAMSGKARQKRWRAKLKHHAAVAHRTEVFSRLTESTAREAARLESMPRYSLLLCDPPWQEPAWSEAGMGRSAENRYRTMALKGLKALVPPAGEVSTIFMWTTSTYLAWAMELLTAWDFTYGGFIVWNKQIIGKGRRFRLQAELLVYGNRGGGLKPPVQGDRVPNILNIRAIRKKGEHSAKPPEIRALLARQYPGLSRVEMFSRDPPDDEWDVWGNEVSSVMEKREPVNHR